MPFTSFHPLNHGFRFANRFANQVIDLGPLNITTRGRCGGMVYAALDYWRLSRRIPTRTDLPPDGDPLADFILDRQMKSMVDMGPKFLTKFAQQAAPHIDIPLLGELGPGLSAEQQFQSGIDFIDGITIAIDRGNPIPVGLIAMGFDPAANHQVLAIGYDPHPDRTKRVVHLYDPNHPMLVTVLTPDSSHSRFVDQFGKQWRTLFNHDAHEVRTPPTANTPSAVSGFASARHSKQMDVFWVRPDRGVESAFWGAAINNARWNPPIRIAPAAAALAPQPIAAVSRLPEHLDVIWIGPDRAVGSAFWSPFMNAGRWSAPFPITPPRAARSDSPLTALARLTEHLDVFWIGGDGAIGSTFWDRSVNSGDWNPPFPVTPPGAAGSASGLAACSRSEHHMDVFWIGSDGAIGSTFWSRDVNRGYWNAPFTITPPRAARAGSPLAAVSRLPNHIDVFWVGPDGAIGSTFWSSDVNRGRWNSPFPISPPAAAGQGSGLAAACRRPHHVDVFWVGADGALGSTFWSRDFNAGKWNPPFPITPPGAARQSSPVAALAREAEHIDVFWIGPDGAVASNFWDRAINQGYWNTPFPISPPGAAG